MEPAGSASSLEMVAGALAIGDDGAVGGVGEVEEEGFVRLEERVAVDGDGDRPGSDAVGEGEGAAGGEVVAAGGGGAVGGGVIDAEGGGAAAAGDGEGGEFGAGIALAEGDVVDADRAGGLDVIVGDGGRALAIGEDGAVGGAGEVEEEGFVRLEERVAVDGDRNRAAGLTVGEGEGAAGGEVVAAGGGGAVSGGVIDAEGGGAAAAGDGEGGEFGAGIALAEGDVVDDDRASGLGVIVGDGGRALAIGEDGAVGGAGEVEEEGFVGLEERVAVDGDGDRPAGLTPSAKERVPLAAR